LFNKIFLYIFHIRRKPEGVQISYTRPDFLWRETHPVAGRRRLLSAVIVTFLGARAAVTVTSGPLEFPA
jgi:hypothetical protein